MTRKRVIENDRIAFSSRDITTWPMVNTEALDHSARQTFLQRKKAVDLYMQNELSIKEITKMIPIERSVLRRLVKRCLSLDDEGNIWGYRALIPHRNLKPYERKEVGTNTSMAGALAQLFCKYPEIKGLVDSLYLKRDKKTVRENIMSVKYIHKQFLEACRQTGLTVSDYPFCTAYLGQRALYRYLGQLDEQYMNEGAKRHGEQAARTMQFSGRGTQNSPMIVRPFHRVQFDGHSIDAMISITFQTPEGDEIVEVLERIWLLTIIDVATRTVLGYYISLNTEYTSSDVLQCIKNAIVPWSPKKLTIPGLTYPDSGGFASNLIPETTWGLWEEFWFDNAKANLAHVVRERLTDIIGCSINAGPVNLPERRGIIERFFLTLEENGFHRLTSTTGGNPHDPRRQDPEKKAIKYRISTKHLEELTEVLIANYNGTPHEGVNNLTPLEAMKQRIEVRGMSVRQLENSRRNEVAFLSLETKRTIKGDTRSGKRPYIQYENVIYRSEVLARSPGLIGTKLNLLVNTEDLRVIRAFLPDGSEFGYLTATGKWGVSPHSLQDRKAIFRLRKRKLIHFTSTDDPIDIYHNYLQKHAPTNKRDRNRLADIQRRKDLSANVVHPQASPSVPDISPGTMIENKTAKTDQNTVQPRLRRTITY